MIACVKRLIARWSHAIRMLSAQLACRIDGLPCWRVPIVGAVTIVARFIQLAQPSAASAARRRSTSAWQLAIDRSAS